MHLTNFRQIHTYFKLIRYPNLIIIGLTQVLIFHRVSKEIALDFSFAEALPFVCISMVCILTAAAGYVVNDIFDYPIDLINKPSKVIVNQEISKKKAWFFYWILVVTSFLFALLLDIKLGAIWLIPFQVICTILLYLYAFRLKKMFLLGNLLVSILCALVIGLSGFSIETIQPLFKQTTQPMHNTFFLEIYLLFSFLSTFFREIIKDMEDIEGDKMQGCKTMPIVAGIKISKTIALLLMFLLAGLLFAMTTIFVQYQILNVTLFILAFALIFQTYRATEKMQFHRISHVTKLLMLLGLGYLI
jgi:4-hydroxybenzoate polyprenyltransferase